jgi:uncharacterized protein YdeI (YjbR/CyaY-like superfamily)
VAETGLKEEIKWGVPVYTHNGKNIVTLTALKDSANIGFFKGVLLTDTHKLLQQQGNIQSDRLIKFRSTGEIQRLSDVLTAYILEAIALEESGIKVVLNKNPEPMPDELLDAFANDPEFKQAFEALTPGRQRAYIINFSEPVQSKTRVGRIEKWKDCIMEGKGIHDVYKASK